MASKKKKQQSENLYEPVNPPPLYGNESYLSKDLHVPQAEERTIEIPPEIEILTSEGLDGLDKPDPHDGGFDGDREWQNLTSEDEQGTANRSSFTAGLRKDPGEPRPTTPKSVGFAAETITHECPEEPDQEVPEDMQTDAEPAGSSKHGGHGRRKTPFDILKSKAADAADHVKQKIKGAIPVRPKMKGGRKRGKAKHTGEAEEGEQEVPEDAEMKEAGEGVEGGEATEKAEEAMDVSESKAVETGEGAPEESEEKSDDKESKDDEKKRQKAEEKEEKERKKAEEKLAKQQAAEEAKKAKLEEKLAKAKEAEEARQAKAEEERKKQEEKKEEEARKAAEKAAKEEEARKAAEAKKEEDARKAAEKAAKEEEARKVAAAKKAEEDARKAAEKAAKEEEARKAAEIKKAEDEAKRIAKEEAKKAAEAKKAEEEAKKAAEKAAKEEAKRAAEAAKEEERRAAEAAKEEERRAAGIVEEVKVEEETKEQTMDTTEPPPEGEQQAEGDGGEAGDEEADPAVPQTPSGTTKRRYIKQRKNPIQLPQIPNPITMLRNQVEDYRNKLKRSRTPPRGRGQRKQRRSRSADASRSPPRDVGDEEEETGEAAPVEDTEMEPQQEEKAPATETKASAKSETKPAEAEPVKEAVQQSSAPAEVEEEIQPAEEPPATTGKGTTKRKQPAAKEKLDKLGGHLKSIGAKTIGVASQATGAIGQTMKVVGKDLQKLGSKGIEKCQSAVVEIKAKQNAAKNKEMQGEEVEEEVVEEIPPPEIAPPKRTFRFRRRNESQDEGDEEDQEHFYENAQEINQERQQRDDDLQRNRLLGRADRDWESPMDRAQSRDVSEEPYISSRDSPPGSSITSSTIANARRPGVLEEIDSDEFFLRERGISEGEDEEEVNRFLVEELRQAFRPTMSNALAGFDLEPPLVPPPRPDRPSRKPAREAPQEESAPTSYQTFPPERPKRKGPQGYVSKFMKENEGDEEDEEYMGSNEEVRGSSDDMKESIEEGDEAIQMVKDKLSEIDRELDEGATSSEPPQQPRTPLDDYEDDGRYEPISDKPVKPMRTKKKAPKRPPTPPSFYYNTIAGNEWLRELEAQVQDEPAAPIRKRRGSGKSASLPPSTGDEEVKAKVDDTPSTEQVSDTIAALTEPRADSAQEETFEGSSQVSGQNENDYIDEAGYAIVQKDNLPRTVPRKKKKRTKADDAQGPSGLRQGEEANAAFMSLPHRPFQVVPPARPSRTYSTLKPKRPPRSKSGSRNSLESKSPSSSRRGGGEGDEPRPSTAIGIMQGRPLPPPPRPSRSPAPLNDLDQSSIEQALGVRHYANFEELEPRQVEEIFTASNIPLLGPRTEVFSRPTEVDIACQTDPVPDDEFMAGFLAPESPLLDSSRIRTASSELAGQETQPRGSQATATGDKRFWTNS
ncbi:unnamed protein product [Orchesella dallaii]|uniref:Uncharacterized protein n=1 Tax=Orchesella dallaii TaxID=48710 RepID=A0ABP1PXZ7_9HEXA